MVQNTNPRRVSGFAGVFSFALSAQAERDQLTRDTAC